LTWAVGLESDWRRGNCKLKKVLEEFTNSLPFTEFRAEFICCSKYK
jgi:hypothetical protein